MALTTRFTEAFGLTTPIAQAGMAFVGTSPGLAVAVSNAGALGGQHVELHKFSNLVPMRGATTGDLEEMPLLAGQGVGLVNSVEPAAAVIATITAQAQESLDRYR